MLTHRTCAENKREVRLSLLPLQDSGVSGLLVPEDSRDARAHSQSFYTGCRLSQFPLMILRTETCT